jgi:hypothetical protein
MSYLMLYSVDCNLNDHRAWFRKYKKNLSRIEDVSQVFNSKLVVSITLHAIVVFFILTYVLLIKPRLICCPVK